MSEDYTPYKHDREPRSEGWREETERISELLHKRGDLRIGQLLINAIGDQKEDLLHSMQQRNGYTFDEACAKQLFGMEASELEEVLENHLDKHDMLDEEE